MLCELGFVELPSWWHVEEFVGEDGALANVLYYDCKWELFHIKRQLKHYKAGMSMTGDRPIWPQDPQLPTELLC